MQEFLSKPELLALLIGELSPNRFTVVLDARDLMIEKRSDGRREVVDTNGQVLDVWPEAERCFQTRAEAEEWINDSPDEIAERSEVQPSWVFDEQWLDDRHPGGRLRESTGDIHIHLPELPHRIKLEGLESWEVNVGNDKAILRCDYGDTSTTIRFPSKHAEAVKDRMQDEKGEVEL